MAEGTPSRAQDLYELLMGTCSRVERLVLTTYVQLVRPDGVPDSQWSLDHFLHQNKTKILRTETGRNCEQVLFPGYATPTKLKSWQLHVLHFIIKEICVDIPKDVQQAIKMFKVMRNEMRDRPSFQVTEEDFRTQSGKVKRLINTCLDYIGEGEEERAVRKEMEDLVQQAVTHPVQEMDELADALDRWHLEDKLAQLTVKDDQETELKTLSERCDRIISIHEQNTREKLGRVLGPRPEPQVTSVAILLKNCPPHQERSLSRLLKQTCDHLLHKSVKENPKMAGLTYPQVSEIRNVLLNVLDTLQTQYKLSINEAEEGCLVLKVKCETLADLCDLYSGCIKGKVTDIFAPLQNLIRSTVPDADICTLQAVIFKDDHDMCKQNIVKTLDKLAKEVEEMMGETADKPYLYRKVDTVSIKHDKVLVLNIASATEKDRQNVKISADNGSLQKLLSPLQDVLRRSLQANEANELILQVLTESMLKRLEVAKQGSAGKSMSKADIPTSTEVQEKTKVRVKYPPVKHMADIDMTCADDDAHRIAITGLVTVADDRLVGVDIYNCCAKLVNTNTFSVVAKFKFQHEKYQHDDQPWNVTDMRDGDNVKVAVTLPMGGRVAVLNVNDSSLSLEKYVKVGLHCKGIKYSSGKFYISFGIPESCVRQIDTDGNVVKTFPNTNADGTKLFVEPMCIAVNEMLKTLYVSETTKSSITCYSTSGELGPTYKCGSDIISPRGIAIGPNGSLFIVGYVGDVVSMMTSAGEVKVVLDAEDGIEASHDVTFCSETNRLYVTCRNESKDGGVTAQIKIFEIFK